MKTIFFCGDDTYPLYHPVGEIREIIYSLFDRKPFRIMNDTEHFEGMDVEDLERYDIVMLYSDHWKDKILTSHQLERAFVHYVAQGGNVLVLHNPDMMNTDEFAQMAGTRMFREDAKPERKVIRYAYTEPAQTEEKFAFELEDETFPLVFSPLTQRQVFLRGSADGKEFPAGWNVSFGKGNFCYIMPGHDIRAFQCEAFQRVLYSVVTMMTEKAEGGKDE